MAEEHLNILVELENKMLKERLERAAIQILHMRQAIEKQRTVIRGLKSMLNQALKGDDDR